LGSGRRRSERASVIFFIDETIIGVLEGLGGFRSSGALEDIFNGDFLALVIESVESRAIISAVILGEVGVILEADFLDAAIEVFAHGGDGVECHGGVGGEVSRSHVFSPLGARPAVVNVADFLDRMVLIRGLRGYGLEVVLRTGPVGIRVDGALVKGKRRTRQDDAAVSGLARLREEVAVRGGRVGAAEVGTARRGGRGTPQFRFRHGGYEYEMK